MSGRVEVFEIVFNLFRIEVFERWLRIILIKVMLVILINFGMCLIYVCVYVCVCFYIFKKMYFLYIKI